MKPIFFEEDAKTELRHSAKRYDQQRPGLGRDFTAEVTTTIDFIRQYPLASPSIRDNFRRARVRRFPFSVIYAVEEERLVIVAVMHHRRQPDYWVDRV